MGAPAPQEDEMIEAVPYVHEEIAAEPYVHDEPVETHDIAAEAYVHNEIEAEPYVHEDIAAEPYVHTEVEAEAYVHEEPAPAPAVYQYAAVAPVAYAGYPYTVAVAPSAPAKEVKVTNYIQSYFLLEWPPFLSPKVAPYAIAAPYYLPAIKTGCINSVGSVVPCAAWPAQTWRTSDRQQTQTQHYCLTGKGQ